MKMLRISLVSLLVIVTTGSAQSATIRVPEDYPTIQAGVDAAENDDVVLVADGTYVESLNFLGKAITVESASGDPEMCIIDGGGEAHAVAFSSGEGKDSILRGFAIQNGGTYGGRGIYCWNSSPTIVGNTITGNRAGGEGGGIRCSNSSPTIANNNITDNEAGDGGGIYCHNSSPIIVSNTITKNRAHYRGAIYCDESSASIVNNVIAGNKGGIYCINSTATITSNTIVDNSDSGIFCAYNSTLDIVNTILWNDASEEISLINASVSVSYSNVQGGYPGVGNIDEYPRFVGIDDYNLSDYSPCIGAGMMTQDMPDTDIEGNPRPNPTGSAPDIGAYESNRSAPLPPPPRRNIHISTTGSDDTGDGSSDNPYLTIQRGIIEAFDGDTVLVADGTYVENLSFLGKAITVESVRGDPELCIIDGDGKGHVVTFDSGEGADSILRRFTIQNGEQGIYCWNSSPTLTSNIITGNLSKGISCSDSSPAITSNMITGNSGTGVYCIENSSVTIVNNTILANKASYDSGGVYCSYNSSIMIINTILWDNVPREINTNAGNAEVTYSDIRGGYPGVGNIDAYPNFAGVNDYHLSDYSPCIGAGMMTQDVPDTDIEGNPRPNPSGTNPDMGAYENRLEQPLLYSPVTIHVSTTGSDKTGDGSLHNPYLTIEWGIMGAFDGDTVLVADGTYMENLNFHGKVITVQSASGEPGMCIIDGGGEDHVVTFNSGEDIDSILRGFTIQNGRQGIYCWNSSPTIASNIITNSGTGISCSNSSLIITSNTFDVK